MSNTAVARRDESQNVYQLRQLRSMYCQTLNDAEFNMFMAICDRVRLDPFARQIYAIKRRDRRTNSETIQVQISIEGYRAIADRNKNYGGQEGPEWCGEDGVWRNVWLSAKPPAAARVKVIRKDWIASPWTVAYYEQSVQLYNGQPTQFWEKGAANQLAKCAEAAALRRAFQNEIAGLYSDVEMAGETSSDVDAEEIFNVKIADIEAIETSDQCARVGAEIHACLDLLSNEQVNKLRQTFAAKAAAVKQAITPSAVTPPAV